MSTVKLWKFAYKSVYDIAWKEGDGFFESEKEFRVSCFRVGRSPKWVVKIEGSVIEVPGESLTVGPVDWANYAEGGK